MYSQLERTLVGESPNNRLNAFEQLLSAPLTDVNSLRRLSWHGIPQKYRPSVWSILLGHLPANTSRRRAVLNRRRMEYKDISNRYATLDTLAQTENDLETLRQIHIDILRTAPEIAIFKNKRVRNSLERLLFTWAIRNPASSYVQGMNDLVTPFFIVFLGEHFDELANGDAIDGAVTDEVLFEVEADSYWCLTKMMSEIQDHYTPDQPGIQRMMFFLEDLVAHSDGDLYSHLCSEGIELNHFSFRWMNCFFIRELPLRCVIRLWDAYLSEGHSGFNDLHVHVCAAFLNHFSSLIMSSGLDNLWNFMNQPPTATWGDAEIELMLSKALSLSYSYQENKKLEHMRCQLLKEVKCGALQLSKKSSFHDFYNSVMADVTIPVLYL